MNPRCNHTSPGPCVEPAPPIGKSPAPPCVIGRYCVRHNFIHGAEAEELREALEKFTEDEDPSDTRWARRILDKVDARDSLAYCEALDDEEAVEPARCDHTSPGPCVEPGGCERVREARRLVALVDGKEG